MDHIKIIHEGLKNHKCEFCEKSFSKAWTLKGHINQIYNGLKDHSCDIFSKSFATIEDMRLHIKKIHYDYH